jgi:hypothetical protein
MATIQELSKHLVDEMKVYWDMSVTENIEQHVRMIMSAKKKEQATLKDFERAMEQTTDSDYYMQLSGQYLKLWREQVRLAVVEIKFGVKR